jgi:cytochrome P450 family 12
MMRPKSAMMYIGKIEDITMELLDKIDREKDAQGEVSDLTPLLYPWALESIASIFLNTRLGCLADPPSEDGAKLIAASDSVLGKDMFRLVIRPPLWKYLPVPAFRRFDAACMEILRIADMYVQRAAAELQQSPGLDGEKSVLEKLIASNGGKLDIPVIMAIDAMMAGIDTTGNTAAFLLYHLASNPGQQEELRREVEREVGAGIVTEANLKRLQYLRACLQVICHSM